MDVSRCTEKSDLVDAILAADRAPPRRPEPDAPPRDPEPDADDDAPEATEHMNVLFELLPFYRQGDASTDAVATGARSVRTLELTAQNISTESLQVERISRRLGTPHRS